MKRVFASLCTLLFLLLTGAASSQNFHLEKAAIFRAFPDVIECKESDFSKIFEYTEGKTVTINLGNKLALTGTVITNVSKYNNLQTVAIKVPLFNNTIFSLSKRHEEKSGTIYIGHFINPKNADGYELKRTTTGTYQLIKIETDNLLPACVQR